MPLENEKKITPGNKRKKNLAIYIVISLVLLLIVILMLRKNVPPVLGVSPTVLDFGEIRNEMAFILQNTAKAEGFFQRGVTPLKFTIDTGVASKWLSVYPASGVIEDKPERVMVKIDRRFLPPDITLEELRISSNGGDHIVQILVQKEKDKIIITSPTANSTIPIGDETLIEWLSSAGVSGFVNISLYLKGENIATIAQNYNAKRDSAGRSSYLWKVSSSLREDNGYAIRVEDVADHRVFDEVGPVRIVQPISAIKVLNHTKDHQIPSTVQFIFSLRNQNNHAILFTTDMVDWKNIKIWENEKEIDYSESHALLSTQDGFQLQVMLVLDFSASMYKTQDDIGKMLISVKDLIDNLREIHQVGVVEFHRPDEPPMILYPFTTYKDAVKEAIDNFSKRKIYQDFSICWDAVIKGLERFPGEPDPNIFKTLVFLSDGFDNSSFKTPDDIIALAKERDVHVFVVGIGAVREEKVLQRIAFETGGTYVHSDNLNVLRERFKQTINDVKGQYKIKYISPKKPEDGRFKVKGEITYSGITGSPLLEDEIDPASIFGKTTTGVIRFTYPSEIKYNMAEIFVWCEHAPRYINDFLFWIGTEKPYQVLLTTANGGGLCHDWALRDLGDGWYRLTSPDPNDLRRCLDFGAFGTLFKIVITDIDEEGLVIPFQLDNSIYDRGQAFYGEGEISWTGVWSTNICVGNTAK
ncbi:MAG: VWA domain-containing protein [Candidatus Loosdrechtia sp.]|uniref:VWA domain-containing protein n=1 Tax=Candidatus Loosdrechtia sp. TaxID=3101272 RepID=UPI003A69567A|nr:MAG: VWA domain-containing protein [Candidatus Jettenia sp. AMX2]